MSESPGDRDRAQNYGWCSLRLRFEARELVLLRGAEQVRGAALARTSGPTELRTALTLAKAGRKVGAATPAASVTLDEAEVRLLVEALKFATDEVQWVFRSQADTERGRRDVVVAAFTELADRGAYRSYGLARDLEAVAARLRGALTSVSS